MLLEKKEKLSNKLKKKVENSKTNDWHRDFIIETNSFALYHLTPL